jgi:Fe-S cluster biosynthesis and repair protein YggX
MYALFAKFGWRANAKKQGKLKNEKRLNDRKRIQSGRKELNPCRKRQKIYFWSW